MKKKELRAERDLLIMQADSRGARSGGRRCYGLSSEALVLACIRRRPVRRWDYPSDRSDLAACERVLRMLPGHLRSFGNLQMALYRDHVERRYPGAVADVLGIVDSERAS